MKKITPIIRHESMEKQLKAGRFNPALELVWNGRAMTLSAGQEDDLEFWMDDGDIIIASSNSRLGYVALQIFNALTGKEEGDVFFQDYDAEDVDLMNLGWDELRNYLLEYA